MQEIYAKILSHMPIHNFNLLIVLRKTFMDNMLLILKH